MFQSLCSQIDLQQKNLSPNYSNDEPSNDFIADTNWWKSASSFSTQSHQCRQGRHRGLFRREQHSQDLRRLSGVPAQT